MFNLSFTIRNKRLLRWLRYLNPADSIAGLEISDAYLRYLTVSDDQEKHYSLALPKGLVVDGQVRDKDQFILALRQLKSLITRKKKDLSVIVTISASNVYAQIIHLPLVSSQKINEVARLNMEMISPIDSRQSYYDWQMIQEELRNHEAQLTLFSAFINRKIIDDISDSLISAGFFVVAIEPRSLSLARAVHHTMNDQLKKPYLIFSLSTDGLDFIIVREGSVHFNYFVSWQSLHDKHDVRKKVNIEDIKEEVISELRRLLNYYTGEWGGVIEDLVFVSAQKNREIVTTIQDYFKLTTHSFTSSLYPHIDMNWIAVLGGGLRGLIAREKDVFISLARVGTEDQYVYYCILRFFSLWRNVFIAITVIVLILYSSFFFILNRSIATMHTDLDRTIAGFNGAEVLRLQDKATQFNTLVDKVALTSTWSVPWSSFFALIYSLAQDISFTSFQIQSSTRHVVLQGVAESERKVLAFKTKLLNDPRFRQVSLPLTSISVNAEGMALFSLSFDFVKDN